MSQTDHGSGGWQRTLVVFLTAALGAAGLVLYLFERQKQRMQSPDRSLAHRPAQAITVKPPAETRAIQTPLLPLTVSVSPAQFVRGQTGSVRVETLPGALCVLEARYSTGAGPRSLETRKTADKKGQVEWQWQVGSSGTHVDVTVEAQLEGYTTASQTKRIRIAH